MEIEEDEEKMWYCLNCVAGMEIDLLRQCRQRCEGMDDVEKFVVPMMTAVRSHGANRMVKDTKVKYQGYVFAKLRLCPETYETIQGEANQIDRDEGCRSFFALMNLIILKNWIYVDHGWGLSILRDIRSFHRRRYV